jgi:3-oxoacyl-[acyl-carrier protein] reductase/pyridoxal 4-dehydrogenase
MPRPPDAQEEAMKLKDRVAIVTGAAQGIGKAIADKLAEEGATVVVADLNGDGAEKAAPAGGAGMQVDVSKEEDVDRMVAETVSRFGKLDVLVNNAAIVPFTPWDEIDFAEWRRIMAVNLDGVFLACHRAQKPMREAGYGRIVNIASNVVLAGTPNLAHYVASKGGVFAFTRALARELGKYGITVNSVAPGLTETEGSLASPHKEAFEFVQILQCIPRRGVAADIAPAVAFLCTEEAGWVTGQLLVADAGMSHN